MGTAASHSSEEEEEGAEEGMEGAAGAPQAAPLLPPAEVLLEQARLREATARLREAALPEPLVSRHHSALVRWLEERLSRGDEAVSLEQFCEVLESVSRLAAGSRGESEEVRAGGERRPQLGRGGTGENISCQPLPRTGTPSSTPGCSERRPTRALPAVGVLCPGRGGCSAAGEPPACRWGSVSPGPGPSTPPGRARTRVLVGGERLGQRVLQGWKSGCCC